MNSKELNALAAPMLAKIGHTIDELYKAAALLEHPQKRIRIQNNLNGMKGQLHVWTFHAGSRDIEGRLPIFMDLIGELKQSVLMVTNPVKRAALLEGVGHLTSQFLTMTSTLNQALHAPSQGSHPNWNGKSRTSPSPRKNSFGK